MNHDDQKSAQQIRERLNEKARAYAARDLDAVMDIYHQSPTVTVYDPGPPEEYYGFDAVKALVDNFISGAESMDLDYQGNSAVASGDFGASWNLVRIKTELKNGAVIDVLLRQSDVWQRVDGKWKVIHEHNSMPMTFEQAEDMFSIDPEVAGSVPTQPTD
jgi:ketosteroid isomerase-like protein